MHYYRSCKYISPGLLMTFQIYQFGKFPAQTSPCLSHSRYNIHRSQELDAPLKVEGSPILSFSRKEHPRSNTCAQGLAPWFPKPLPRALPIAIYYLQVSFHVTKNLPHICAIVTVGKSYHLPICSFSFTS